MLDWVLERRQVGRAQVGVGHCMQPGWVGHTLAVLVGSALALPIVAVER